MMKQKKKKAIRVVVPCVITLVLTVVLYAVVFRSDRTSSNRTNSEEDNIEQRYPTRTLEQWKQEMRDWLEERRLSSLYTLDNESYDEMGTLYSLGQLSKLCDWVVVGKVEKMTPLDEYAFYYQVLLSVDTHVYGKLPKKKLTFNASIKGDVMNAAYRRAKPGDRMLVFLSDKELDIHDFSPPRSIRINSFEFDRAKNSWGNRGSISLCSPAFAYVFLDDKETEKEVIRVVKGYLGFFGEGGKRDREAYYGFLVSLLQSPVERVRNDAISDLIHFHLYTPDMRREIDRILADERICKDVRDYLRYRLGKGMQEEG